MNRRWVWEFSVTVALEAEEAVAELLGRVFRRPATVCTNLNTRTSTVSIYALNRCCFLKRFVRRVNVGLGKIADCGLEIRPARVRLRRLRQKNWAEAWKKQFKPIRISSRLLIKPSWSKAKPRQGLVEIVLDPGLAFGTGHHPTTVFCLRQIVKMRCRTKSQSFLDVGTGSGILAIAAAKLGFNPVLAFDSDANAVRVAKANIRRNKLTSKVRVLKADVATLRLPSRKRFDLVCANLNAELLTSYWRQIAKWVAPTGALVLAGVLKPEFEQVCRAYEKARFVRVKTKVEKGWQSGLFLRK